MSSIYNDYSFPFRAYPQQQQLMEGNNVVMYFNVSNTN